MNHRMLTYLNNRSGRVKLTNANLMYSADKGYFNFFLNTYIYIYLYIL